MELLQYEPQVEHRGPSPWRFATPMDAACLVVIAVHGIYLLSQAVAVVVYRNIIPVMSFVSARETPELIGLVAQVVLVALAVVRLTGRHLFGLTMAMLVIVALSADAIRTVERIRLSPSDAVFVAYTFFPLAVSMVTAGMVVVGATGKVADPPPKQHRRRWWLSVLMAAWVLLFASNHLFTFYQRRFGDREIVPAVAYVQPVLGMGIFSAAACVLAGMILRARHGDAALKLVSFWLPGVVLIAGCGLMLLVTERSSSSTAPLWIGMTLLGEAAMVFTGFALARTWHTTGRPSLHMPSQDVQTVSEFPPPQET